MTPKELIKHYQKQIEILEISKSDVEKTIKSIEDDYDGRITSIKMGNKTEDILERKNSDIETHQEYLKFIFTRIDFFLDQISILTR